MPRSFTVASLVVAALSAIQVQAQPSTNATCTDQLWSFNSLQQSPCLVAAYLSAPCTNDNTWTVLAVNGGYYAPPTKERANTCQCNTVTWNLLSACSMCQGGTTGSWTEWITNCTNPAVGKYVLPIPPNVTVPHWAYYDFTATGVFNAVIASQQSGPESSAIPSMTSTGSVTGTSTPSASSTSSSDKSTNTGAIAGGVVGAVLGLGLIGLIAFVLVRRSRQGSRTGSATPMVGQYQPGFQSAGTTSHSGSKYVFKPYDPNDPSTFPPGLDDTTAPSSYTDSLPHTNQSHARPGHYTGAAHV